MARSDLLLSLIADGLGVRVERPHDTETTVRGAALAAGLAAGLWSLDPSATNYVGRTLAQSGLRHDRHAEFEPSVNEAEQRRRRVRWERAVALSVAWADEEMELGKGVH